MPYKLNPFTNRLDYYESGGGGGTPIEQISGDSGSITGSAVTIYADQASNNAGASVLFENSGTVSTFNLSDADNNTFLGRDAGNSTLTGAQNISIGTNSLQSLTDGNSNICIGQNSGDAITGGDSNIGIGTNTISAITTVDNCIGIGNGALATNQVANTVAVGGAALGSNTTGDNNQAFGYLALSSNTTGGNNTACGRSVFGNAVSNENNTGVGYAVGLNNTGDNNTVMGSLAFVSTGSAANNAFFGYQSGNAITSGGNNTGYGYATLNQVTTGTNNVALGYFAGQNYSSSESNNILIQNAGVAAESGKIRIGTSGTHNATYIQGIAGVTVSNAQLVTVDTNGQLGSIPNNSYLQIFYSPDIDMTTTGVTTIFTAATDFLITNVIFLGIDLTGTIGSPSTNLGWTAAAYDDFANAATGSLTATDEFSQQSNLGNILVPSGQIFRANVTVADGTATTHVEKIIIQGFYI